MTDQLPQRIQGLLDDVAAHLSPDAGDFIGRQFVRDGIAQFTTIANRMLVLVSPPGVGKTALAAELVRESLAAGRPHLAHFCSLQDGADPSEFVRGLALQLQAALGPDYRLPQTLSRQLNITVNQTIGSATADTKITGVEIKELKLGSVHPREAFRLLVREPLRAYDELQGAGREGAPLVIVIDALDRAWEWDGGQGANIVSLLADVQDLPPWVNLICTARPGPAVQTLRAQAGVRVFEIDPLGKENLADVRAYFEQRFLGRLTPEQRERFLNLLLDSDLARTETNLEAGFVRKAVDASQGNFLFVRRYVAAWRAVLAPTAGQPAADPSALLRFDSGERLSLASALDASYQATLDQIQGQLEANERDADEAVLGALAIAFEPLNAALLRAFSGRADDEVKDSLRRLAPVLARTNGEGGPGYALYHRGFADFVRRVRLHGGRELDLRAARALELADGLDKQVLDYAARYRYAHLLRGLAIGQDAMPARAAAPVQEGAAPQTAAPSPGAPPLAGDTGAWQEHVAQVQAMARAPATQAQLLRALAAQAMDPARSDTPGSWAAALGYLRAAERTLRRSRALLRLTRRGGRIELFGAQPPEELLELERTLIALGDAYATIARRLDGGARRTTVSPRLTGRLYLLWNTLVRLPLTAYLLLVLLLQGVREIHIPGALQNLGREQDWAVARLLVLAVSAYRRAGALARAHGAEATADDVVERLGRVYMFMGAYDIAAATYETLLARPAAIMSPWRRAVWLLALGEVLLAQREPDRAVEVLNSALPTFDDQMAPVLLARAHTALAAAQHMQAEQAELRGDDPLASQFDDLTIASGGAALAAWRDVTNLQGDDLAAVDPPLAISRVAHLLRRTAASARISDEQHRRIGAELERVTERHFAQRFEHPVLRLFRVAATVLLPAYILAALLLAIHQPITLRLSAPMDMAIPTPLVDLGSFPNNLVAGGTTTPSVLSASDIAQLLGDEQLRPITAGEDTPPPAPVGLPEFSATALGLVLIYLALYTIAGLLIVTLVSPAHLQHRRPGRVILHPDALVWRGTVSEGTVLDVAGWLRERLAELAHRALHGVSDLAGRTPDHAHPSPAPHERRLALADIAQVITVNRRALGFLLGDFSSATVQPAAGGAPLVIPGTLDYYDELGEDLRARFGTRYRSFDMEIVRSLSGLVFLLTVLYALALVLLVPVAPAPFETMLPAAPYSVGDLYVLAAPCLVLPLAWWFVAQPLGAARARAAATRRLLVTATAGGALALAVGTGTVDANLLRLDPDLFTPSLALAILAALVVHSRPPLLRVPAGARARGLALGLLMLAAAAGIALVSWKAATTALWYHSRVQGDNQLEQALADDACLAEGPVCRPLHEAIRSYTMMTCLRPRSAEGYAMLALAHLVAGEVDAARASYHTGLALGEPDAPPPAPGCLPPVDPPPSEEELTELRANLAAVEAVWAQELPPAEAELAYDEALTNYALALDLTLPLDGDPPTCYDLARELLAVDPALEIDRYMPPQAPAPPQDTWSELRQRLAGGADAQPAPVPPEDAWLARELAKTCYSRSLTRAEALARDQLGTSGPDEPQNREARKQAAHRQIWQDLSGAVAIFSAVAATPGGEGALREMATALLLLGQIDLPPESVDPRSFLLRAESAFSRLAREHTQDLDVLAGQAWSAILLGALRESHAPLEAASALAPDNPTYPALRGYAAWLESARHEPPSRVVPSPAYTRALLEAVRYYSTAIELSHGADRSRAYATRSALHWSLRNSPSADVYRDEDYGYWMNLAIADVDQALVTAEAADLDPAGQVGYRYWRGRLNFSLGLTWQRKLRGRHEWRELVPLYARALDDFETAARDDPTLARRKSYTDVWGPWARYMLANASQMQQAEESAAAGDWERARRALELVTPQIPVERQSQWDRLSGPLPEYALMHGLISLALGIPEDFTNQLTGTSDPAASYARALADIADGRVVPRDARRGLYERALADLERLIESPGVLPRARAIAMDVRAEIQAALEGLD
ncbi:MAG TPA: hypothetical protein VNL77_01555 [Roseiflexaceae bacterium]|nr:hypothetical protein [Roseiflexaceae bacterium]